MASENLPYAVCRPNKDGSERWYWQRKGHPMKRLSADPGERVAEVTRLNKGADTEDAIPSGSIAWCVKSYRQSDEYKRLKPASLKIYDRWLDHFGSKLGRFQASVIKRPKIMEMRDQMRERYGRATVLHAFAVLKLLFGIAEDYGHIEVNPARKPKLSRGAAREAVWTDAQVEEVLAVAAPHVALGLRLLLYTAQRPSDVVRMPWSQYDGRGITVRQLKTGALIYVPAHRHLKAALDAERRRGPLICVRASGRAWKPRRLTEAVKDAMAKAKVSGLQIRDLRRTAVVKLAEAGAEIPQIAAITGHSLANAEKIVQVYLPRTKGAAIAGMLKWEQNTL